MGLIKSNNLPTSLSPFSMKDVEDQARGLLSRARRQAEQLLSVAQLEAEKLKETAREEGLAEGRREGFTSGVDAGRQAGKAEAVASHSDSLKQVLTALTSAASVLDKQRTDLEAQGLADVVQLAIAIARKVTKRQSMLEPEVLAANLEQAMSLVSHCSDIRIAVRPEQRQVLAEVLPELRVQWPNLTHVELIDDSSLSPGGCRVHTRQGLVNTDLDEQLDRVVADLLPLPSEGPA